MLTPALLSDQGNELHAAKILFLELFIRQPGDPQETLMAPILFNGNDQPAADGQLLFELRGHGGATGGNKNGIERGLFRPPAASIANVNLNVVEAQRGEPVPRKISQGRMTFDRNTRAASVLMIAAA